MSLRLGGGQVHVIRGEVWWARVNEKRPIVVLSTSADDVCAMMIVPPATNPIEGVTVEVELGASDGLPFEGVVRVALPRPGLIPCHWLVTLSKDDLVERAGTLSPAKLAEVDELLRRGGLTDASE
jgi:mRNA interferase MazF